ncbi:MAG: hypothetical protein KBA31_01035 [Alphaproteobacteria bacterium]|nr:hypothetical protein [Alphaproteobacteria bacterium]
MRQMFRALLIVFTVASSPLFVHAQEQAPAQCVGKGFFGGEEVDYKCVAKLREAERDSLRKKQESSSTMSYVGILSFANLCPVFRELGVKFTKGGGQEEELKRASDCYFGRFDPEARANAILKAQALLGEAQDGWLRSDQAVRLVCRGMEAGKGYNPASDRFAGWMFATGMGLPQDKTLGAQLLYRAKQFLAGQKAEDVVGDKTAIIAAIDASLARLTGGSAPVPATDTVKSCTAALDVVRQEARSRRESAIGDARVVLGPTNKNVGELSAEVLFTSDARVVDVPLP